MLLLNGSPTTGFDVGSDISIHLMLLLNTQGNNKRNNTSFISIHLMLLLNPANPILTLKSPFHFNTSYVVIKHIRKEVINDERYISIHLMLLLNAYP